MAPMEVAHFSYCYGWQRISADSTLARAELCLRADIVAVIGTSPGAFGSGPTTASKDDTNGPLIFSRYCGPLRRGFISADCQLGFLAARRGVLTSAQTAGAKLFRIRHSSERVPSNSMTRIERYIVIALVTAVLGA